MVKYTIRDVARLAHVSVGTASMALNGKSNVNEETRKRVFSVANQLNYNPNPYARFLTSDKTNFIGLIVTDATNPFFGNMIDLLQQELSSLGYDVILCISRGDLEEEKKIIQKFIAMKVCGIIAVPSHHLISEVSHFQEVQNLHIPLCFITSYHPGVQAPCVMTDLRDGAYQLTQYLLENGHRNIAYLAGNLSSPVSNLRVEGHCAAYRDFGLVHDQELIVEAGVTLQGGYVATQRLLEWTKPDAIITINDFMAIGVLKFLKEHRIKVPEEISVAGYDDLVYTSMLETPLTTVHQPLEQICKRTVAMFLQQLEAEEMIAEKVLLKPTLVIRSSSGAHGVQ